VEALIQKLAMKLGYEKNKPLEFLNKRVCGIWLVWIGVVIIVGTVVGGIYLISPFIFFIGYFLGVVFILGNKSLRERFSFGSPSKFQSKMSKWSIIFMFLLMILISGRYFDAHNYRMIWLGALLATSIHFIPFATVHGKSLLFLSVPLIIIALLGMMEPHVPFNYFVIADGIAKMVFGLALLLSKNPRIRAEDSFTDSL
jgi:hypothetical protein